MEKPLFLNLSLNQFFYNMNILREFLVGDRKKSLMEANACVENSIFTIDIAKVMLWDCLAGNGDCSKALMAIDGVISSGEEFADAFIFKAQILSKNEQYADALEMLKRGNKKGCDIELLAATQMAVEMAIDSQSNNPTGQPAA